MRKRGGGKGGKLTDHSYSGQRTVPNTRAVYLPSSINLCFISKIVRIFWISLVLYILYTCVPGTVPYLGTRYSFYGQKIIGCTLLLNISVVYMCSNEFIQITKITMAGPTIQRGKKKKTQNRKITSSTVCSLLSIPR